MIVTRALTKRYGRVLAVDRVDLDVREGDRYGFLGPNGSGKTTVVRMLLGLVYATSGEIEVMGKPVPSRVAEVLPQIGALVEGPSCYGHLSGRANLALIDASGRAGARPAAAPAAADRRGAGPGRPGRRRQPAGQEVLARDAPAARARGRAAARPAAARARRADQRPGPAGHPRDPRPARRAEPGGHHGVPVQSPARRGRAVVHPGRHRRPGPARPAGGSRRAASADRPGDGAHPGRRPGRGPAGRPRGAARRRPAGGRGGRPGRGQRPPGRRGAAGFRDRPGAALAGGADAVGDRFRLRPDRRAGRGPAGRRRGRAARERAGRGRAGREGPAEGEGTR